MVAARAGVSRSTVSRVINWPSRVPDRVVDAVRLAIEELGYVPNQAARSLASHRALTIALVIPQDTSRFFADPYYSSVIPGVTKSLSTTDYTLSLLISSEADAEKTRRYLLSGNVDGALVLSHHTQDALYVEIARELPMIFAGRPTGYDGDHLHIVDIDNEAAARTATTRLVDAGRTRIASIAGPQDIASGIGRLVGWREAINAAGQADDLLEFSDWSVEGGVDAARRLLRRGVEFDGLFAASAQIAAGAMEVLRENGRAVPYAVAITTIDNDHYATSATPPLTTIEQPTVELGATIAESLVQLIAGEPVAKLTILPTRLVEHASV
ncbi:MAG TPA: LacI family DNA-binding transcriptional regulator [Galbitalea sp.]|jgi:LacI family transcriptional regulator|nr:LacI family DNA-binding transcriptional regulator [Galbitalea sp.]